MNIKFEYCPIRGLVSFSFINLYTNKKSKKHKINKYNEKSNKQRRI